MNVRVSNLSGQICNWILNENKALQVVGSKNAHML